MTFFTLRTTFDILILKSYIGLRLFCVFQGLYCYLKSQDSEIKNLLCVVDQRSGSNIDSFMSPRGGTKRLIDDRELRSHVETVVKVRSYCRTMVR